MDLAAEVRKLQAEVQRLNTWLTRGQVVVPMFLAFLGYINFIAVPSEAEAALKGTILKEHEERAEEAAIAAKDAERAAGQALDGARGTAKDIDALLADLKKRTPIQDGDEISFLRGDVLLVVDNLDQGPNIRTGWRKQPDPNGRTKFKIEKQ